MFDIVWKIKMAFHPGLRILCVSFVKSSSVAISTAQFSVVLSNRCIFTFHMENLWKGWGEACVFFVSRYI